MPMNYATVQKLATRFHEREILQRLGKTSVQGGMPPLAKDVVDADGVARVKAFVDSL